MSDSLLDKDFLSRLEYLYIMTRELFVGHVSSERLSRRFGVGIEFADYRAYVAGDDYRYVDWYAFARRDDLLIKLFTEERAAPLYFVLDASASMGVGAPQKLLYAKRIAAALGYIGLANLDPVTIVAFDHTMRMSSRLLQGRGQLQSMLYFLEEIEPGGNGTALGASFQRFIRRFPSRGIVVLLSDFLDHEGYEETLRLLHYHRYDLVAIRINDREELEPSLVGDFEIVDSETGERITIQATPASIAEYKKRLDEHYFDLERLCRVLNRSYLPVVTDAPFEDVVFNVFRRSGFLR